jgi:hypothetical protein
MYPQSSSISKIIMGKIAVYGVGGFGGEIKMLLVKKR